MENRNIQTGQETHCGFHDQIWSISHEGGHRQFTHHILIKEECSTRYYQDDTGLPNHSNAQHTQGVESGDHISRTRIWIHRKTK